MAKWEEMPDGSVRIAGHRYSKGSPEAQKAFEAEQRAERAREEEAKQKREADERAAHARFIAAGGTEEQWAKEKDAILAARRQDTVLSGRTADDLARAAQSQRYQ